jgi:hypothetical protein
MKFRISKRGIDSSPSTNTRVKDRRKKEKGERRDKKSKRKIIYTGKSHIGNS